MVYVNIQTCAFSSSASEILCFVQLFQTPHFVLVNTALMAAGGAHITAAAEHATSVTSISGGEFSAKEPLQHVSRFSFSDLGNGQMRLSHCRQILYVCQLNGYG